MGGRGSVYSKPLRKFPAGACPQLHPQEVVCEPLCPGPGLEVHILLCVCLQVSTEALLCSSRPTPTSCWTPPHLPLTSPPCDLRDHVTYSGQCKTSKTQGATLKSGPSSAFSGQGQQRLTKAVGQMPSTARFCSAQRPRTVFTYFNG